MTAATGEQVERGDTGEPDPQIAKIAATIKPDWALIDAAWDGVRRRCRDIHLRRDAGLDGQRFLHEALAVARAFQLLRTFAVELYRQDLVGDDFDTALGELLQSSYQLQAFQDNAFLPVHAYRYGRGLIDACGHVCRISIHDEAGDWKHRGTGVLVRPRLVATAAHVIWPLVEQQADGTLRAAPDSVGRITLTFGNFLDFAEEGGQPAQPRPGQTAKLHDNWLVWGSAPTPLERSNTVFDILSIDSITAEAGPWDVVLLRLAGTLEDVRPSEMRRISVPAGDLAVQLLHHPTSGSPQPLPLLLSTGRVDRRLGAPPVRFLHTANTLQGSSGAPVYDAQWRVVALHQAGQRQLQNVTDAEQLQTDARNRAVPVDRWLPQLEDAEKQLDTVPYLDDLSDDLENLPFPYPVVGRRLTQQAVHAALAPGAPTESRLLIVRGPVGSGRRFTRRLVGTHVVKAGHLFKPLDLANLAGLDAAAVAERILLKATETPITLRPSGTTTGQRDIRDVIAPAMIDHLGRLGGGKQVWLHLDGLASPLGEMSPNVLDLLSALVEKLATLPHLRLVLVGWSEKPPTGFEMRLEELLMPTAEDIAADIAAHFTPAGVSPDPSALDTIRAELARLEAENSVTGYPAAVQVIGKLGTLTRAAAAGGPQ